MQPPARLTPPVCTHCSADLHTLVTLRLMLGISESIITPCLISYISSVIPSHRRGLAISFVSVGKWLGSGFAMFTVALSPTGWRATSFLLGSAGLIVVPCLIIFVQEVEGREGRVQVRSQPVPTLEGASYTRYLLPSILPHRLSCDHRGGLSSSMQCATRTGLCCKLYGLHHQSQ
jgi:MFS family permease